MRKKIKHIIAIFFGLLTASPFLFLMLLEARQLHIKQEAKKRLKSELLQTISIPVQDVIWEEKGRELIIDGELFDIDSCHIKDGYLVASGIFDKEETEFVRFLRKQTDESKGTTLLVQWLVMSECLLSDFSPSPIPQYEPDLKRNLSFYLLRYCNSFTDIIIPPPRFIFNNQLQTTTFIS